jgi:hypothetical protein
MKPLIYAVLIALVIVVILYRPLFTMSGFTSGTPRTMLNYQMNLAQQANGDLRREIFDSNLKAAATYAASGSVDVKPAMIAQAEQEQWMSSNAFDSEKAYSCNADDYAGGKDMDYDAYVTNLVVDSRTLENHHKWVNEMKPFSGVARSVDDMEEAVEASTEFVGLRRAQPIVQYNPLQLTEKDTGTFISNPKFNFRG